jgi:hypothetical protein
MTDPQIFDYEVYRGHLDNGQQIMVQIFREPSTGRVLHSQFAFRSLQGDSWGVPIQLEKTV